ncbi:hypothetical protein EXIGLDRAFT_702842 [Exidia glandulosa HHB12029]|uniref:Uncharacterized protein n=1 Tax=Exidia glandulosa HHB12029 TaxID=1314781 RepID=A0A165CC13_EXIGL|nr:hypothetical protein EXIGLDRAFT_702842 [Exidia glandulosa HHB12029]
MLLAGLLVAFSAALLARADPMPSAGLICDYICPYDDKLNVVIGVHYYTSITNTLYCRYPRESGDTEHWCVYDYTLGSLSVDNDGPGQCRSGATRHCTVAPPPPRNKRSTLVDVINARRNARREANGVVPDAVSKRAALRKRSRVMERGVADSLSDEE